MRPDVSAFGGIVAVNRPVTEAMADDARPDLHRGGGGPGLRGRRRSRSCRTARPCASSRPCRRARWGPTCGPSTAATWSRRPTRCAVDRSEWQVMTERRADRGPVGRPGAGLAGGGPGDLQRHRAGQGRPGRGDRLRPAEPGRRRTPGRPEGGRSGRGRRLRQRRLLPVPRRAGRRHRGRAPPPSSSRAARSATARSSPRPTPPVWPWSSPASATSGTDTAEPSARRAAGRVRSGRCDCGQVRLARAWPAGLGCT